MYIRIISMSYPFPRSVTNWWSFPPDVTRKRNIFVCTRTQIFSNQMPLQQTTISLFWLCERHHWYLDILLEVKLPYELPCQCLSCFWVCHISQKGEDSVSLPGLLSEHLFPYDTTICVGPEKSRPFTMMLHAVIGQANFTQRQEGQKGCYFRALDFEGERNTLGWVRLG